MITERTITQGFEGVMHKVVLTTGVKGNMIFFDDSKTGELIALTLDDAPPITSNLEGDAVWLDYSGKNKKRIDTLIQVGFLKEMYQEKFIDYKKGLAYLLTDKWTQEIKQFEAYKESSPDNVA